MKNGRFTGSAAAVAVALGLIFVTQFGSQAQAGARDLSGTWDINYLLSCDASLTQTGSDVTGTFDCVDFAGTLEGTYMSSTRALSLTGSVEGFIPIVIDGEVDSTGDLMGGTFSAEQYVPEGHFVGSRLGTGSAADISGDWAIAIDGVFSGGCTADVEQDGSSLTAESDCGPVSDLEGEFNEASGQVTLTGTVLTQDLTIEAEVSADGSQMFGTWEAFPPNPLSGAFSATRRAGSDATATPVDDGDDDDDDGEDHGTPHPSATAGPAGSPGLAPTGSGPGASSASSPWLYVVVLPVAASVVLLLAAGVVYRRGA
jgi:hypothetical protein